MNWTWNVRSNDGAMNGLEFARCTTAEFSNHVGRPDDWAPPT
jgi:hypothetical protein